MLKLNRGCLGYVSVELGGGQAADLGGSIESVLLGPVEARAVQGSSFILGGTLARSGSFHGLRQLVSGGGSGGDEDGILQRRGAELRAVC
jgi:hypothetical protein